MHKVHSIFPFPIYRADMKQKITEHDIDYRKNHNKNLLRMKVILRQKKTIC